MYVSTSEQANNKNTLPNMNKTKSNQKLSNNPTIKRSQTLEEDSGDQPWTINQIKRLSSPGHSPKAKEQKIIKDNKFSLITPNRFEPLTETENDDGNEILELILLLCSQ